MTGGIARNRSSITDMPMSKFERETQSPGFGNAQKIYHDHQHAIYVQTDRMFAYLMTVQWLAAVFYAFWASPRTWDGTTSSIHPHVWAAIFLGGAITVIP